MRVKRTNTHFGCIVEDIDLSCPLPKDQILDLISCWEKYQLIIFRNQHLTPFDLERLGNDFGGNYKDLFLSPLDGYEYVCEVRRDPTEQTVTFGSAWHSDWFNAEIPPSGTILYAREIPPAGGDTLFADQYKAYDELSNELKKIVDVYKGANSARAGYSLIAAKHDQGRSMKLLYSKDAHKISLHPLATVHPKTGKKALTVNEGYTFKIDMMNTENSDLILKKIFEHQTQLKYLYRHVWQKNDLLLWDNRSLIHAATGGYDGYRRILHRVSVK